MKFNFWPLFLLALCSLLSGEDGLVDVNLSPTKADFSQGRAIPLRFSFINTSNKAIKLRVNYPTFCVNGVGLKMNIDGIPSPLVVAKNEPILLDGSSLLSVKSIPVAGKFEVVIYLNRYFNDLGVGGHSVEWSFNANVENGEIEKRGNFGINVQEERDFEGAKLEALALFDSAKKGDNWQTLSAIEGLVTNKTKAVVGALIALNGYNYQEYAVPALARFSEDESVQKALLDNLGSSRDAAIAVSLRSLVNFNKLTVSVVDIDRLVESKSTIIKNAVWSYLLNANASVVNEHLLRLSKRDVGEIRDFALKTIASRAQR